MRISDWSSDVCSSDLNQPVDDRLPDKLTALGRDRCQRLQLFGIMFSCHFNSPSVCKTMLTGRQRIPARANARGGSRQVSSGCGRRKAWLTCAQDRGHSCHSSANRQCLHFFLSAPNIPPQAVKEDALSRQDVIG